MSISEFSLFDEPSKDDNKNNDIKLHTKQKLNFDNISDVFSFNKKNNFPTKSTAANDNTDINSPILFNNENVKEVSLFTLNETEPKALNRKIDFCKEAQIPMDIDDFDESENSSSICISGKKEEKNKIDEDDNLRSDKKMSDNEQEEEEEKEFKYIRRESKNSFCFQIAKFDEDYVIIKTLCAGETGTVYLCMKFQDKKTYVVKMTNNFARKFDYYNMKNFLNCLIENESDPGSMFIQKYIDFWIEDIQTINSKTSNRNMYIVTEYCLGGDLKEYINKIQNLNYDKTIYWDIIFQMIYSVAFLHKLGYVHFDIKPSNFLIKDEGQLLLSDFCLTIKEKDIINYSSEDFEGDSMFISPELFYKDRDIINKKTDIFSLGLSILQILINVDLPKNGLTWQLMRTVGIPEEFLNKIPNFEGDGEIFKKLIISMTNYKADNRPDLENILKDKETYPVFYQKYQEVMENKYKSLIDLTKLENFRRDSYDFTASIGNFKKKFAKRSNSMKFVEKPS
jgi:serine/threonine protein kinase